MTDTIKRTTGTKVAFGEVVQLSKERSKDPEADGFERYIGLEHLEPSDLKVRSWGHIADGVTFTNVFRPGQVLFGKRRAYQRKVAVADFSGVCSGDIYVLEPKGEQLLPELLPFICQSEPFYDYVISMSQGGLSPRVNWKALAKYEFALPPLEEQRRIERLLNAIERERNALIEAVDAAVRLRTRMSVDLKKSIAADPDSIASLLLFSKAGLWGSDDGVDEVDVTVLRSTDLNEHGELDFNGGASRSIPMRKVDQLKLRPGDLFLEKSGGGPDQPVGRIGLVESIDDHAKPFICGNFIQLLRVDPGKADACWLFWLMHGMHSSKWTLRHQTQTTGIRNLQTKDYLDEQIAVPSINAQQRQAEDIRLVESSRQDLLLRLSRLDQIKRVVLGSLCITGSDE